jgi:hypothetical protein
MKLGEFQIIWQDWLRGVTLMALVILLATLYFLKVFSQPVYTMLLLCSAAGGGLLFVIATCVTAVLPLWLRISGTVIALGAGGLAIAAASQLLFPGAPIAAGAVSNASPETVLDLPPVYQGTQGYLTIRGYPGASPSGDDEEVTATVKVTVGGPTLELPVKLVKKRSGGKGSGKKGPGISRRGTDSWELQLASTQVNVLLTNLRPRSALPFDITVTVPPLSMPLVTYLLWALAIAALLVAVFTARNGSFPVVLPFATVAATVFQLLSHGISPTEPLLPGLGILLGGGIAGAAAGYLPAKILEKFLAPTP